MDSGSDQMPSLHINFMERLRESGLPIDFYQRVIDDEIFRTRIISEYKRRVEVSQTESSNHKRARSIMGKHFIGISEVERFYWFVTDQMKRRLSHIPFSEETLQACAKTHILMADIGLSINKIYERTARHLFYYESATNFWFGNEAFAQEQDPLVAWKLVRLHPIIGSSDSNWVGQKFIVSNRDEYIPKAREIIYMWVIYQLTSDEELGIDWVRTSTSFENGQLSIAVDGDGVVFSYDSAGDYAEKGKNGPSVISARFPEGI